MNKTCLVIVRLYEISFLAKVRCHQEIHAQGALLHEVSLALPLADWPQRLNDEFAQVLKDHDRAKYNSRMALMLRTFLEKSGDFTSPAPADAVKALETAVESASSAFVLSQADEPVVRDICSAYLRKLATSVR